MNINPDAKRILCYGDSLTWGYVPGTDHDRYPLNVRWTGLLQKELGLRYEVIEEGLCSRGITSGDSRVGKEGRSGIEYIRPCLDTHAPLDVVIVLLGTNELKEEKKQTPKQVSDSLELLLETISTRVEAYCRIIVASPPLVNENTEYAKLDSKYIGAAEKSKALAGHFSVVANKFKADFLDFADLKTGLDGVHFTEDSHAEVAKRLAILIRSNL